MTYSLSYEFFLAYVLKKQNKNERKLVHCTNQTQAITSTQKHSPLLSMGN